MKKLLPLLIFLCLPLFLHGQDTIERIEIIGNEHITRETVLYYIQSSEGNLYNEEMLRRDFRSLWSTGFFSNIKMENEDGGGGKIVRIIVEENPIIKSITYKTGKKLKESDINEKLQEEGEYLLPHSYYNPYKIQKIKKLIEDLLFEKGLTAAEVEVETNKNGQNDYALVFSIKEGPREKVGAIEFVGDTKLPQSVLRGAMKDNKKHGLLSWIGGKDVFRQNKLNENIESIREKLRNYGYMEATIGEPRVEEITRRSIFLKKKKMKKIIIPVNVGYLYRVGKVSIEGNEIIAEKFLRDMIKFKEGDIYKFSAREESLEDIQELYADIGHLYAQVYPVENMDPKRKRVSVTFNILEGDVVFVNKLEFKGNTYTKDKVLRREMLIAEGSRFRLSEFKNSILRLQQLGLVELQGEPDVKSQPDNPTLMDVTLNVTEIQRNNIQFSAGYSGYDGTFIALNYSTVNFLGAGEQLSLMVQHGKRVKNYMLGFTEPYFLDLPINLGFNVFDRYTYYPGLFEQKSKGASFLFGARVKGYLRTNVNYSYEYVRISVPDLPEDVDPSYYYNPYQAYDDQGYKISSVTPSLYRSTINSPLTPTRGSLYLLSCKFAGGFLGGEITMIKPRFEWTLYKPVMLNHVLGFHLNYEFIKAFSGSPIPIWERFYLGGERSIRGYGIYQIGPRNELGYNLGGEKSLVFNAEYIIPFGDRGPVYGVLFYDMGNALRQGQKFSLKDMFISTGLEMRIFVPALRIPFRLIFAYNSPTIRWDDSNFAVRFAIGTTF
jgi:outer membrane protein insertion porin family